MCNCGKKRVDHKQQADLPAGNSFLIIPEQNSRQVNFQYTGKTALTIIGSATGKRYRFNYPGDTKMIDDRDEASMTGIPVLMKIERS